MSRIKQMMKDMDLTKYMNKNGSAFLSYIDGVLGSMNELNKASGRQAEVD
jgi:hypothetical protein